MKISFGEEFSCVSAVGFYRPCKRAVKNYSKKIQKKIIKKIHKQIHALNSFGTSCQFWGSMMVVSIDLRADANRFVKFRFLEKRKC